MWVWTRWCGYDGVGGGVGTRWYGCDGVGGVVGWGPSSVGVGTRWCGVMVWGPGGGGMCDGVGGVVGWVWGAGVVVVWVGTRWDGGGGGVG